MSALLAGSAMERSFDRCTLLVEHRRSEPPRCERDLHRLVSGGDLAAIAQQRLAMRDVNRAGDLHLGGRGSADRLLGREQRGTEKTDQEKPAWRECL